MLDIYKSKNAFYEAGYKNFAFTEAMEKPIKKFQKDNNYDLSFIGLRKQESQARKFMLCKYGKYFFCKKYNINQAYPLSDWKTQDIFAYIFSNKLEKLLHPAYYKNKFKKSEKIRVSWYCDPTMFSSGHIRWLSFYYPELFNQLCIKFPEVRGFL